MSGLLPPALPFLGAAVFFGLSCVLRFSFYLGFIERPVAVALIWGALSGEWEVSLALGIFFELFWMDLIGAGTYIPPNANFPLLLCLFLHSAFLAQGLNLAAPPLVPIVVAVPLAFVATSVEQRHRVNLNTLHERLVEDSRMDSSLDSKIIAAAVMRLWALETLLFAGFGLIFYWLFELLTFVLGHFPGPHNLGWPALWLTAALGGVLSLRTRRAVCSLAVSLAILSVLMLHG